MIRTTLGFILACATVGPITYMAADREPPYIRLSGEAIPSTAAPEDEVVFKWQLYVQTHRICKPVGPVRIRFIDSASGIKDLEPQPSLMQDWNNKFSIERKLKIPMGLAEGTTRYRASACFACNIVQEWFRPICVGENGPDIYFQIKRKNNG